MPHMNGLELYQRIKDVDNDAKVCFITAFDGYQREVKDRFPKLDIDCFIRKPIEIQKLDMALFTAYSLKRVCLNTFFFRSRIYQKAYFTQINCFLLIQGLCSLQVNSKVLFSSTPSAAYLLFLGSKGG
jgi:two-component SAPR family response regulator